jgi:hypothetical protein
MYCFLPEFNSICNIETLENSIQLKFFQVRPLSGENVENLYNCESKWNIKISLVILWIFAHFLFCYLGELLIYLIYFNYCKLFN